MFLFSDHKTAKMIRLIIAALAILNLIALFVFDYSLPFLKKDTSSTSKGLASVSAPETQSVETLGLGDEAPETETSEAVSGAEAAGWSFYFEPAILEYNGEGEFDILYGATLMSPDGTPSELEIFTNITTAETLNQKVIEYRAETPDGPIKAGRRLQLNNYDGPSLSVPDELPSLPIESLDTLLTEIYNYDDFFAMDGYGNGITSAVTVAFDLPDGSRDVGCTFSVTNMFGDTVSKPGILTAILSHPVLRLKAPEVEIKKGEEFHAESFVSAAIDIDGTSLMHSVSTSGSINTSIPGDYQLEFTCSGASGERSEPQMLVVHVVE